MVRLELGFSIAVLGCRGVDPAPPRTAEAAPAPAPALAPAEPATDAPPQAKRFLLGVLGERGTMTCPQGNREWIDVHPMIGFVSISGVPPSQLEPLMGQAVIAEGTVTTAPERPPSTATIHECPGAQMRSDWIETPRGIVLRRGSRPAIEHFAVHAVRRFTELAAGIDGDDIVVTIANPLPDVLTELKLVVHYEGCFGKPGTAEEVRALPDLPPGERASVRAPALRPATASDSPRAKDRGYAAHSVQVQAKSDSATFDLDVAVARIGAPVQCPERGMK